MAKTKVYRFKATGGFDVNQKFKEIPSCVNGIMAFKLPDGRSVSLVIALEVEAKDGHDFKYITSESEMAELGFEGLDYGELIFEKA